MELVSSAYFDRFINLTFYSDGGNTVLGAIMCPKNGAKPDITIEGSMVSAGVDLTTKITITNFEWTFSVTDIDMIGVSMGYYGMGISGVASTLTNMSNVTFYNVFTIDQSKAPPDKQTMFYCIVGTSSKQILNNRFTLSNVTQDANGYKQEIPFGKLVTDWINCYNDGVDKLKINGAIKTGLRLSPSAVYLASDIAAKMVMPIDDGKLLSTALTELGELLAKDVETSDGSTVRYGGVAFSIYQGMLYVAYKDAENAKQMEGTAIMLDYCVSAVRNQVMLNIVIPYDPRIFTNKLISIPASMVVGKKNVVATAGARITALVLPTSTFKFGTIRDNAYNLKCVIPNPKG